MILDNYGIFDFDYINNMISIIIKNKLKFKRSY